jgi:cytidine deaminase
VNEKTQELLEAARKVMANAYAPYNPSQFKVGAAVRTVAGGIYVGCNVENASFGLTICAERNAVFAAVAKEGPEMRLEEIAIATSIPTSSKSCGACRQVLYEFGTEAIVSKMTPEGLIQETVSASLPGAFGPQHLPRKA